MAFGYGLGSFIEIMGGLDYFVYILAGTLVYMTMFSTSLEVALVGYQRTYGDRLYDYLLTTPVNINHIVIVEILWGVSKSILTAAVLLVVGFMWYSMPVTWGAGVVAFGLALLFCFTFAAASLVFTAYAKSYEFFAYFFVFWISPAMFFGGVFYDLDNLPEWAQYLAQLHPVTQAVAIIRPLLGNLYIDPWEFTARLAYILVFGTVMAFWARAKLKKRLFT
jgi:lipooligosaccharide transport system permease protein